MAAELVVGAFLSASLDVLFDRLASLKVMDFFKGRKLDNKLLYKLKRTMQSVEGVLDDAEEKQITSPSVRKWLDDLKDAFYEADDLLDEIAYAAVSSEMEARPQNSIGRFWKFISSQHPLEEMESNLLEIHEKLQDLLDQKNALGLKEGIGEKPSSKPTTSLMDESVVYGRDEDKEVIIQRLLSDDANCNKLGLIPIVGMGGVGKTTLAQSVCNNSRVKERFGFKAWIYVSEEFDVLKVTKNILNGVSTTKHDFNTLNTLQDFQVALKKELTDKKFLLVLDDVWNDREDDWNLLLKPLKAGAKGSKIIVTTRLQSVASVIEDVYTHHLEGISEEECWALFSRRAFEGMNSSEYPKFEEIGREIVKKCNGLPLAAKSLGSLLRKTKQETEEWDKVLQNDIWNLSEDNILPALRLSYYFLPSHLKQCFAYCAIFPKGHMFKKEQLALLWMGEGFLDSMKREVTGEECFDDLVARSFFKRNEDDIWLGLNFIMHDLIVDLARSVAGDFCFRLDDDDDSCEIPPKTRHLRYFRTNNFSSYISEGTAIAPLRTFLLADHEDAWCYHHGEVICDTRALMKFERLRVLSLSVFAEDLKLDDSIRNLKHLRHLDLSGTSIRILPESLCCLYNLKILLLVRCDELVELPSNLGNLTNLCVLDIEGTRLQKMPPHMGKLSKLQKLNYFMIGKESETSIQELGNLRQLRGSLVIRNLENVMNVREALKANIKGKKYLKELQLVWEGDVDDRVDARCLLQQLEPHQNVETLIIRGYGGTRFPDWINGGSPLLRVVTLKLDGCKHCCHLPPLRQLVHLKELSITDFPRICQLPVFGQLVHLKKLSITGFPGICQLPAFGQLVHLKELSITDFPEIVSIESEFYGRCTSMKKPFQCLEVLRFKNMTQWQKWDMCGNEEVFHLLQELYIIDCPAFKQSLPQHLPSLITLEFWGSEGLDSLPTIPRIHNLSWHDLSLKDGYHGYELSATGSHSTLHERIEQLRLFVTLQEVSMYKCDFLKRFPLESFSNLKALRLSSCPNLEAINGNFISSLSLEIKKCPNLRQLLLEDCSNLKWLPESMHSLLYSLEVLIIRNCPKLESFPEGGLPLKLERLEIVRCTELINRRNQWNLYCLPSLLKFVIEGYEHAECFPEESLLPPTLTSLTIRDFPNLKSLEYKGIQHLTSLQRLIVSDCPELRLLPEEGLPSSLTYLGVWGLQNLESLVNNKIQQLANLEELLISNCPKLKSVPEEGLPPTITYLHITYFADLEFLNSKGLRNLTSLQKMRIYICPKLRSLPEEGLPLSLFSLTIEDCPLLEKRCEWEKGEDWPKISHISNIELR